ncbi:MAG: hypothetical protein U0694_16110 [Anaerolineae bacterium]
MPLEIVPVAGTTDGDFLPLGWHIHGEMGGVWAQPIAAGWLLVCPRWPVSAASLTFHDRQGYVQMEFTPQGTT